MKTLAVPVCVAAMAMAGCAGGWKPRSVTQATIYADTTELPLLFANSTFVGEIDGVNTQRGKGYVFADPGKRRFTIFHVGCPMPVLVVFCLRSARKWQIESVVDAGAAYRIDEDGLVEVGPDGLPAGPDSG